MNAIIETTEIAAPDYSAVKSKQNAAWASGDYAKIGTTLQGVGEQLADRLDLPAGARVLDVAAGNGNASLAFARRACRVTSTDYVDTLLAKGERRAAAEDLSIEFQIADAETLPFVDGEFDAVVSTYGVMFTPDQAKAAAELHRVCRSGGRIGLANWTPEGFIGQMFKIIGTYIAPPQGVNSPAVWGTRTWINEHFADQSAAIRINELDFVFRYSSPGEFVDVFRAFYGPVHKAFLALDANGQAALTKDFITLIDDLNTVTDGTMRVPSTYAEIVITKS